MSQTLGLRSLNKYIALKILSMYTHEKQNLKNSIKK